MALGFARISSSLVSFVDFVSRASLSERRVSADSGRQRRSPALVGHRHRQAAGGGKQGAASRPRRVSGSLPPAKRSSRQARITSSCFGTRPPANNYGASPAALFPLSPLTRIERLSPPSTTTASHYGRRLRARGSRGGRNWRNLARWRSRLSARPFARRLRKAPSLEVRKQLEELLVIAAAQWKRPSNSVSFSCG